MHHSPSRPPRGGHPVTGVKRTAVGLVLFTLVMAVVMTAVLYPLIGLAAIALVTAVGVGRAVVPRLRRRVQTATVTNSAADAQPEPQAD